MSRRALPIALLLTLGLIVPQPAASFIPEGFSDVVILGTNSVQISRGAQVQSGDVVGNDASAGPTLDEGVELALDRNAHIAENAKADSIDVDRGGAIKGEVECNDSNGIPCLGLDLPVFAVLPTFQQSSPGTEDVIVGSGDTVELAARNYGDVTVADGGTLVLTGGIYDFSSVTLGRESSLLTNSGCDVRVEGAFSSGKDAVIGGPAAASTVVFYVGGFDAAGGFAQFPVVEIDGTISGSFYVPNGTLAIKKGSTVDGALVGRDVRIDVDSVVNLDTFFFNKPPTADPQDVFLGGADSVEITLTGSDPENDDLTFSIDTPPTNGNLSAVVEDPPPFPGDPPGCNPENTPDCIPPDPPRTSATVTYTTKTGGLEDSFVFKVTDTFGNMDTATVRINPAGDPPGEVEAFDTTVDTDIDTPVIVGLTGDAPEGVSLTFEILSGPDDGTLGPINSISDVAAEVEYTPDLGFEGVDSFEFEACGIVDTVEQCATATATITVSAPDSGKPPPEEPPTADDQNVLVEMDGSVLITLTGEAGTGGGAAPDLAAAAPPATGGAGSDFAAVASGAAVVRQEGAAGAGRGPIPDPLGVFVFNDEVEFFEQVEGARIFDFETASGFPADGYIGVFEDIDFDARTITSSQATSGTQAMTGASGTFSNAVIDFTGLDTRPRAFAFTALDLTQIGDEVIEVTVDFTVGPDQVFDATLGDLDPPFTPIFLGLIVEDDTIDRLTFRGTEAANRGTSRAWLLDDLVVGGIEGVGALTYSIITLPTLGTLTDSSGNPVVANVTLPGPDVTYTPNPGVSGVDFFVFKITDEFGGMATATVTITIVDPDGCTDCYTLEVILQGTGVGDVTSNPTGIFCPGTCIFEFPQNSNVVLQARPIENGTFGGYGMDCSGSSPLLTVLMNSDKVCTATINAAP